MFYFIKFVDNNVLQIILLVSLATLLFYALGSIVQNYFHFKTRNNNFAIPIGIVIYFLITFMLYTPFVYFRLDGWENLFLYLYLIKQFIFTFMVLLFLNSLVTKWNIPSLKQTSNFFVSFILIGFLLWLFHYFLITAGNIPIIPLAAPQSSYFSSAIKSFPFQSIILELSIIADMNNNIELITIILWVVPFIMISFLYWGTKLLFQNIMSLISVLISIIFTIIFVAIFSFLIPVNLIYLVLPMVYLYFVLIFIFAKEKYGENLIIIFAFNVLASIFVISISGVAFLIVLGVPTIAYLFMRAKSTVGLFLFFATLFTIELFFVLTGLGKDGNFKYIYGLIFLVVAIIVLIPMYTILNSTKVKDLIQVEKTIKKNAMLVVYFSLIITMIFGILFGVKGDNSVFVDIGNGFKEMKNSVLPIILTTICCIYFVFCLYICKFRTEKANNLLLVTSLIVVVGFNPLSLALFSHVSLMQIDILQVYYFIFGVIIVLNILNFLQNKLSIYSLIDYKKIPLINKIPFRTNKKLYFHFG